MLNKRQLLIRRAILSILTFMIPIISTPIFLANTGPNDIPKIVQFK
jgi:hypothetical protein